MVSKDQHFIGHHQVQGYQKNIEIHDINNPNLKLSSQQPSVKFTSKLLISVVLIVVDEEGDVVDVAIDLRQHGLWWNVAFQQNHGLCRYQLC